MIIVNTTARNPTGNANTHPLLIESQDELQGLANYVKQSIGSGLVIIIPDPSNDKNLEPIAKIGNDVTFEKALELAATGVITAGVIARGIGDIIPVKNGMSKSHTLEVYEEQFNDLCNKMLEEHGCDNLKVRLEFTS